MSIALNLAALLLVIGISWFGVIWLAGFFIKMKNQESNETQNRAKRAFRSIQGKKKLLGFPSN